MLVEEEIDDVYEFVFLEFVVAFIFIFEKFD